MGEKPKMRCVFFAKFPLLSKIQTISHKLLVIQTSNHHHWNWYAQKPACMGLSSDFEQFFLVKNNVVYFKEQVWLPNRKFYGKIISILTRKMLKMAWYSTYLCFCMCQFHWYRFWDCTFRCFWVMDYMYVLSWKLPIRRLLLEYFATLLKIWHLKK